MKRSSTSVARGAALALLVSLAACGPDDRASAGAASPGAAEGAPPSARIDRDAAVRAGAIDIRSLGYSRGPEDAPVRVYEFSDFGCPFCGMFARATYPQLHDEFVATGRVRWTYVPFVMGTFPNGAEAARASECAGDQDRFWEMHDLLFTDQNEWKSSRRPAELFRGYADRLGLDGAAFETCYREDHGRERTAANNRAAASLAIRGTPSFFVNGRLIEGALPAARFQELLSSLTAPR